MYASLPSLLPLRLHTQRLRRALRTEPVAECRQHVRLLGAEAQHARGITHGAAATPGDLFAHHGRVFTPVAVVHVLQYPLAITVGEVDVDVGRLLPVFAEEAFEQQFHANGIDSGDAQAEADGGVGRRATPLTEDPLAPRESHDVPHDEEVAGKTELADHPQLVRELAVVPGRALRAPPLVRPLFDEPGQILVGGDPRRQRKCRHAGLELLQPERAPLGNGERGPHALLGAAPALVDAAHGLECPLRVGAQPRPHGVEGAFMTQRDQHVVHEARVGGGVVHVVGDHPRHAQTRSQRAKLLDQRPLLRQTMVPALHRQMRTEDVAQFTGGGPGVMVAPFGQQLWQPAARAARERRHALHVARDEGPRDARAPALAVHAGPRDE